MYLPDEYKTGNKGTDEKIAKALARNPTLLKPTRLQVLQTVHVPMDKQGRISVAAKENRTYKDGTLFASKTEMQRWDYLVQMQQAGEITNLRMQVPFVLQEAFYNVQYGKIEAITYVADFVYTNLSLRTELTGREIVEDSKGKVRTDKYLLKRKLFLKRYPNYYFFEV